MNKAQIVKELNELIKDQEAYIMEGNVGAAEELIPAMDELMIKLDMFE
tara:strand:+ start:3576 stop:3719 length:144 start_codon:yes stop_codon:yes gene_type:complete